MPTPSSAPLLFSFTQRFRPVLELLRERGADVDGLLAGAGIDAQALLESEQRLPRERVVLLSKRLLELSCAAEIGLHAAARFELRDIGLLGYLLRYSSDGFAALQILSRYSRLLADAAVFSVSCRAAEVIITGQLSGGRSMHPEAFDFTAGLMVRALALITRDRVMPVRVQLPRARPAHPAKYRKFFQAPVSFATRQLVLVYEQRALRVSLPDSDPQLLRILEQRADELLASLPLSPGLLEHLRGAIEKHIERGAPAIKHVCQELRISDRTLRRRLDALGRSYREILDDVRRERALLLLGTDGQRVAEVAMRLGFADTTGFARAFRRWTGQSPREFSRAGRAAVAEERADAASTDRPTEQAHDLS